MIVISLHLEQKNQDEGENKYPSSSSLVFYNKSQYTPRIDLSGIQTLPIFQGIFQILICGIKVANAWQSSRI